MKKMYVFPLLLLFIICSTIYINKFNATPVITYFPPDENYSFHEAKTHIDLKDTKENKKIVWTSNSKSNESLYLRQDLSLLYINGFFKGVQSKWEEQVDEIHLKKMFSPNEQGYIQSISFHHGEIHSSKDKINSIQTMSTYQALLSSNDSESQIERIPDNHFSPSLLSVLNHQYILTVWKDLLDEYKIDPRAYEILPLINLVRYNDENLPNLTMEQTDQIIGQLWEGLYKNYVLPLNKEKHSTTKSVMPLILFSKDQTHALVLFELNEKKEKLLQKYPEF